MDHAAAVATAPGPSPSDLPAPADGLAAPSPLYGADGQTTDAELQALVHRGALEHLVAGLYCPRGAQSAGVRAAALHRLAAPQLARGFTLVLDCAAWVHVGGRAPQRLQASVPHYHRPPRDPAGLPWELTQTDVAAGPSGRASAEDDVRRVGPVRVTSPLRTCEDLLLSADPLHAGTAAALLPLVELAVLRARLRPGVRRPGVSRARIRLRALTALQAAPPRT